MNYINKNKGFTLIELLVVIAIIGVLSSVVLASLNTARTKGAVAAGKANLANSRTQAELYYDSNNGSYAGVCNTTLVNGVKPVNDMILAAAKTNDSSATLSIDANGVATSTLGVCHQSVSAWAAEVMLKDGTYQCVDNSGNSKNSLAPGAMGLSVTYLCP